MKRIALASLAALSLAGLPNIAAAVPSQSEVDAARATCHSHKMGVRSAEARLGPDHAALAEKRLAWERSCQHAQLLMDARDNNREPRSLVARSSSYTTGGTLGRSSSAEFAAAEQRQKSLAPCDSADLSVY